MITPTIHALAGLVVLAFAIALDEPVSLGTVLGLLLLLSAALRYLMARNRAKT